MERLKGKSILIGKNPNPGASNLIISVDGSNPVVVANNVPNSVSRCRPQENRGHCRIDVGKNLNMVLTNVVPQNQTFVDGVDVESKAITANSRVELGKDRYTINITNIIEAAKKIVGAPVVHIEKLRGIYEEYEEERNSINENLKFYNNLKGLPMLVTVVSSIAGFAIPKGKELTFGLAIIAGIVAVYGYYKSFTYKSSEKLKELQDNFENNYVCPCCGKYLEGRKYKLLLEDGKCKKCGAKFVE
jgi:ribosomal protein L37AE/L43A